MLTLSLPILAVMIVVAGALVGSAFILLAEAEMTRRRRRKRKAELNVKTY